MLGLSTNLNYYLFNGNVDFTVYFYYSIGYQYLVIHL